MFANSAVVLLFCYLLSLTVFVAEESVYKMSEHTEEIVEEKGNNGTGKRYTYGVGDKARCKKSNAEKTYSKKRRYHLPKNKKSTDDEASTSTTHKKVVDIVAPNEEGNKLCFWLTFI